MLETSHSYLAAGGLLMHHAIALDAHLSQASVRTPAEGGGTDVYLDCHRLDLNAARRLFLEIRERRQEIEADYQLLQPAAFLLDYMAHLVTNILPRMEVRPRKIATVSADGRSVFIEGLERKDVPWTMAVYFGISPEPFFGTGLDLKDQGLVRELGRFGFGLYAYLGYALVPALAVQQCLTPEIAREWGRRCIVPARVQQSPDGSFFLQTTA